MKTKSYGCLITIIIVVGVVAVGRVFYSESVKKSIIQQENIVNQKWEQLFSASTSLLNDPATADL